MTDRTGQQFGNYRLIRLLGRGGAHEVYLGEDARLRRFVTIKVLQALLEPGFQKSFFNEARLLAHLDHPYIERVLDFGIENTTPYLVTEYAPGGTLRNANPRGNLLPLAQTASYVKQIASALQYLHDHNIIHRDVKPENMLLRADGEVLLSDPGIATFTSDSSLNSPTITAGSNITGNAAYMAPEQILGRLVRASDQYSLAVVTYEWLAGKAPFRGTSSVDILIKQMNEPPPPLRAINPSIPPEVEEVVMIALSKDPKQRFAHVRAFATAFEQAANLSREAQVALSLTGDQPATPVSTEMIRSVPPSAGQGASPAPGKAFESDPGSQTLLSLPSESDDYQTGSMSPEVTPLSPIGTPDVMPPNAQQQAQQDPWSTPAQQQPGGWGMPAQQQPQQQYNYYDPHQPEPPYPQQPQQEITKGLGNALKKITVGRKDTGQQARELSLFAIARTTVDDSNRAIVGQIYNIEAGIAQNRPEGFRGEPIRVRTQNAVAPLLFDILIHPGDNIELMGAWYQRLRYNPGSPEPQFITCPFRLKTAGHGHLIIHFYRERQWLKAIRFEFEGIPQPQSAVAMS